MTQNNGASADADRAVAADAAEPVVSALRASIPSAWTPHTVAVWQSWSCGHYLAFKTNFNGPWHLSDDGGRTAIFTDEYLQEVMKQAQAIEARRAETQSGSVHESAVGNADAPEPNGHTGEPT